MKIDTDKLIKIIELGKPQFTFGIFMYFLIGALFALLLNAQFVLSKFIWGYLILFMASMAIHYANDYFDFEVDHYGTPTTFTGGSGILIENPEKGYIKKIGNIIYWLIYNNRSIFHGYLFISNLILLVCVTWKRPSMVLFRSSHKIIIS